MPRRSMTFAGASGLMSGVSNGYVTELPKNERDWRAFDPGPAQELEARYLGPRRSPL